MDPDRDRADAQTGARSDRQARSEAAALEGKAKATVAAARKLYCYLYWMLKEGWSYDEWLRQHELGVRPEQALVSVV
jgi:hypothetical protein